MILENKIACVTGGTRGIGFAVVSEFLKEGATVILFGSRKETVDHALEEIRSKDPNAKVEGMYPQITDLDAVKDTFAKIVEKYGRIDILVNNAGVSDMTPIDKYTAESFAKVMDLNVKAVFNCCNAVVPYMKERHSGVILNTSSMVSVYGQPIGAAYPIGKFAVNGLTLSLARELGPYGIRVNAVAPGVTNTDMMRAVPKEQIEAIEKTIPLGRIGTPEDIANAFLFLASDRASYISGEVLHVDGLARS